MNYKIFVVFVFLLGLLTSLIIGNKLIRIKKFKDNAKIEIRNDLNIWTLECIKQIAFTKTFSGKLIDNYKNTEQKVYYLGLIEVDSKGYFERYNIYNLKNGSCAFLIKTLKGDTILNTTIGCYVEFRDDINYRAIATCKKE